MDKEAKRTGNVYHYERTKNARYTFKEMMRMGNSTKFCNQLNHISEKSAQRWLGMVYVVWLDFQQLRLAPPSCLPILNHVNSWRYVIGLRSRRVFFPYATLLKPWPNYPTFVGRTYLLDNMFDGNQTSSNIWLSKNCSMNGYDKQSNNVGLGTTNYSFTSFFIKNAFILKAASSSFTCRRS